MSLFPANTTVADFEEARAAHQWMRRARQEAAAKVEAAKAAEPANAVAAITELAAGLTSIVDAFNAVTQQRDQLLARESKVIPQQPQALQAPAGDAPTVELLVTSRDEADRIRKVLVKSSDGRAWDLQVTGRDEMFNISALRMVPVT